MYTLFVDEAHEQHIQSVMKLLQSSYSFTLLVDFNNINRLFLNTCLYCASLLCCLHTVQQYNMERGCCTCQCLVYTHRHYHSLTCCSEGSWTEEACWNRAEEEFTWTLSLEETCVCQVSGWCQLSEQHTHTPTLCAPVPLHRDTQIHSFIVPVSLLTLRLTVPNVVQKQM